MDDLLPLNIKCENTDTGISSPSQSTNNILYLNGKNNLVLHVDNTNDAQVKLESLIIYPNQDIWKLDKITTADSSGWHVSEKASWHRPGVAKRNPRPTGHAPALSSAGKPSRCAASGRLLGLGAGPQL